MPKQPTKRAIVDTLVRAVGVARVHDQVNLETIRYVLDSGFDVLYAGDVVNLEMLWVTLLAQPGVTGELAAEPVLMFVAVADRLGVGLKLPDTLTTHPEREEWQKAAFQKARIERGLRVGENEQFPESLKRRRSRETLELSAAARDKMVASTSARLQREAAESRKAKLRLGLSALAAVIAVIAVVGSLLWAFGNAATGFDLPPEVAKTLVLERAVREDNAASAVITDPRWRTMTPEEHRAAVAAVLAAVAGAGIESLALYLPDGLLAATAFSTPDGTRVSVY